MGGRGKTLWASTVTGLVLVAGIAQAPAAQAVIDIAPARTWGVGPATTTSATGGKPRVLAILPVGDRIFVGGTFDQVIDPAGLTYPAQNIAVFSATTGGADLSFQASVSGTVTSLATDGSQVFLGGSFNTVNGANRRGLASVSVSSGALTPWSPAVSGGQVDALAYAGGAVFAGGNFTSVSGGGAVSRSFAAKVSSSTGAVDAAWQAAPNERVRAMTVAANGSGRLYLGGEFGAVSAKASTNKLAAVLLGTGAVDTAFRAGPTNAGSYSPVYDLTSDGLRVYAAAAGGGGACAALDATTGSVTWSAKSNGNMQSVRLMNGLLYCAGHYGGDRSFMGTTRNKLAAVNAATGALDSFAPQINSSQGPWSLAAAAGRLYMGGDFNKVSGVPQPHFAMFIDSSLRTVPQPPANPSAQPGSGAVNVSWQPPPSDGGWPVQKYRVYRGTTAGATSQLVTTLSKSTFTYQDGAVTNGTRYYYTVTALNAAGASRPSAEVSAAPSATGTVVPPSAPTTVTISTTPGVVSLTWNPPSSTGGASVTSYRVYRSTTSGTNRTLVGTVTSRTFDDTTGLTPGTRYYYVVTAVNQAGEGPASAEVSAVAAQSAPGTPVLSAALVTGPAVRLTWTSPPDNGSPITKYVILRDSVRLVVLAADASGGPTTYTDTTVIRGATHVYQIRAANDGGNSDLSDKVSIKIP